MHLHLCRISGVASMLLVLMFFPHCTSRKNFVYFQGVDKRTPGSSYYELKFKKDDLLSVTVMAIDPEAVVPFNLPVTLLMPSNIGGYAQGAPTPPGYLVDANGEIDFPVIGKMKVEGLTRNEFSDLLKERLTPYLAKPSVNIRVLNYKITVLGEVRNPGTFTIPNERITLPEALGIAGDLQITGVRERVKVFREVNGVRTETTIDLRTREIFSSPFYYLQQNDIVYVEPNRAKVNSSVINTSNAGIVISVISLVVTIATLLSR